ncbi:MAG: glycosyltransferase family 87 protein [Gaiellales bacterium]
MSARRSLGPAAAFVALAGLVTWLWEQSGRQVSDVTLYRAYGERIAHGLVPYRDFDLEYPPGSLPVFALPALVSESRTGFAVALAVLLGLVAVAGIVVFGWTERREGIGVSSLSAVWLAVVAPVVLGALLFTRYDLLPAVLTIATLAALLAGRPRLGGVVLGVAIAVKLYPVVLLPIAVAWAARRHGRAAAQWVAGLAVGVPALAYLPFAVVAPGGVAWSIGHQLSRPLQIESLGSSLLLAAHQLGLVELSWSSGHGSQNLDGRAAATLAVVSSIVQLAVLVLVWWRFARGPATSARLVVHSAAAVVAFVAFGKVLSPQYLIWPLFLVPLAAALRGRTALGLYAAAATFTALWFPARYWELVREFDPVSSWLVLARNLALVVLVVVLLQRPAERLDR